MGQIPWTTAIQLVVSRDTDCDGDGLTNQEESLIGTDPNLADTDGDGVIDGQETMDGTDPLDPCSSLGGTPPLAADCDIEIEFDVIDSNINGGAFIIRNIENFADNSVEIYNRWGVKVFEIKGYDNATRVFMGISSGRATIQSNKELPVGVYFYIIRYTKDGQTKAKNGYIYINR